MPSKSPQIAIDDLQSTYAKLREFPLPDESQDILQDIDQQLQSLTSLVCDMIGENNQLKITFQKTLERKAQFLSQVSHEIRNPMTAIKGYSDLLIRGAAGAINVNQHKFLDVISSNINRISVLLTVLSEISHLEKGINLQAKSLALDKLLDLSISELLPQLEEKEQTITLKISHDLPEIYGDPYRIDHILTILLSNAHKYTPVRGNVAIQAFQQGNNLRIDVTDNGFGIDKADQEQLFTPFFRSENPLVRQEAGWGLGLYYAKLLVEFMGGEIGVSSTLGSGSVFWFTLPIK
jgi:signal transduction histidine kinase